jgi:hypothetical protein
LRAITLSTIRATPRIAATASNLVAPTPGVLAAVSNESNNHTIRMAAKRGALETVVEQREQKGLELKAQDGREPTH